MGGRGWLGRTVVLVAVASVVLTAVVWSAIPMVPSGIAMMLAGLLLAPFGANRILVADGVSGEVSARVLLPAAMVSGAWRGNPLVREAQMARRVSKGYGRADDGPWDGDDASDGDGERERAQS